MERPPLVISPLIKIKYLEKDAKYYINRSTILYGATGSGKTTILIEILYLLKDAVPNIFVFAPTANETKDFDNIIPSALIYTDVDISVLTNIYTRQQAATKIYNKVNNIESIINLFKKIANPESIRKFDSVYSYAKQCISKIKNINSTESNEIIKMRDKYILSFCKSYIKKNKTQLNNMNLSNNEKYIVKYLNFNPNCIIIFDDCGAILKRFQGEEVVKKILFQGRHIHVNLILNLQDDIKVDSALKKNAFVSIFTTARCASSYFERTSNSFSKSERLYAAKVIEHVFTSNTLKPDYRKLAYIRDDKDPFRYTIANIYQKFTFGSRALVQLCNRVSEKKEYDIDTDPSLESFKFKTDIYH